MRYLRRVKLNRVYLLLVYPAVWFSAVVLVSAPTRAEQPVAPEFRPHFLQLCDLASAEIKAGPRKDPFFVDSYAARALCVAYDMTGKKEYLDACRAWSERMIGFQEKMLDRKSTRLNSSHLGI